MLDEYIAVLENLLIELIELAKQIEEKETYKEKLTEVIKEIEYSINFLFQLFADAEIAEAADFDKRYILEILQDLMNAMANEDRVLLIDVLRFGLYEEIQKVYEFLILINHDLGEA